jgi:23S rRNA (guanosine2251-2'-O)-methyltransferase
MVQRQGKRPRRKPPSGNQQLHWLWGRQSVVETLEANRWQVYELFVTTEVQHQYPDLLKAKQKEGVELEIVSSDRLTELSSTREHEGIVARVSKYPYAMMDDFADHLQLHNQTQESQSRKPIIVFLDRIQDTFNFATILRCCANAEVCAVIVGEHCQAQVTPQIARSSSGAVNYFPIFKTEDLAVAALSLKELGLALIAVDAKSDQSISDVDLNLPIALLIGNDPIGLDAKLLELCNVRANIPAFGKTTTLSPTVAAGVLLYETRRQQEGASTTIAKDFLALTDKPILKSQRDGMR